MKIHTPNGVDRYNGNAAEHKASGFKTLFSNAVALLSTIHPEVHQVKFDDGQSFGADTFCTVALSQFPVDDDVLFGKVAVENNRLANLTFPRDINLVWYDENKRPKTCGQNCCSFLCISPKHQYYGSGKGPEAQAPSLADVKWNEDRPRDPSKVKKFRFLIWKTNSPFRITDLVQALKPAPER
uniref:Uncharacterized protein n=1 Tax=Romanomermis culicivorax TaxID=13658 RepID=A0A915JB88_ROMCU